MPISGSRDKLTVVKLLRPPVKLGGVLDVLDPVVLPVPVQVVAVVPPPLVGGAPQPPVLRAEQKQFVLN